MFDVANGFRLGKIWCVCGLPHWLANFVFSNRWAVFGQSLPDLVTGHAQKRVRHERVQNIHKVDRAAIGNQCLGDRGMVLDYLPPCLPKAVDSLRQVGRRLPLLLP